MRTGVQCCMRKCLWLECLAGVCVLLCREHEFTVSEGHGKAGSSKLVKVKVS